MREYIHPPHPMFVERIKKTLDGVIPKEIRGVKFKQTECPQVIENERSVLGQAVLDFVEKLKHPLNTNNGLTADTVETCVYHYIRSILVEIGSRNKKFAYYLLSDILENESNKDERVQFDRNVASMQIDDQLVWANILLCSNGGAPMTRELSKAYRRI